MAKEYIKEGTSLVESETVTVQASYDLVNLRKQKTQLEAKLDEINTLIAKAEELGVEEKQEVTPDVI